MKSLLLLTILTGPLLSMAQFNASAPRGQKILRFETPNNKQEVCIMPQHAGIGAYSEDDIADEKELCGYDFHGLTNDREVQQMALCAKLNSTNPGVLIMKIPNGWQRNKFESEMCLGDNELQKTEAKFKQTITCSYTPSILAYYHFSRYLQGAGRVPVAVLRTMDKSRHLKVVEQGRIGTQKIGGIISTAWSMYESAHSKNPLSPLIFDTTGEVVYGALTTNVKNEAKYYEIIGGGKREDRYNNFLKKDFYLQLTNPQNILDIIGSNKFETVAQPLNMLKDASDLILLDTLLNQQDRMYNQHFKWAWTWVEKGEVKRKRVKAKQDDSGKLLFEKEEDKLEKQKYEAKGAVLVKEMILKDNDCGVRFPFYENRMKKIKAIDGIRHMSGITYKAFMTLAKSLKDPAMHEYIKNETLMTAGDLKAILGNVAALEVSLKEKCRAGDLKLDLDLDTYFTDGAERVQCDI